MTAYRIKPLEWKIGYINIGGTHQTIHSATTGFVDYVVIEDHVKNSVHLKYRRSGKPTRYIEDDHSTVNAAKKSADNHWVGNDGICSLLDEADESDFYSFTCPVCGGHEFGNSFDSEFKYKSTSCHNCRWNGVYEGMAGE